MTIFDMPNFLWITIALVLIITAFGGLALGKWVAPAVFTFIVLGVLAFFIPNFTKITYQPLLGYAAFMAIISLIESFLIWYFTRDFRRRRLEKRMQKELREQEERDSRFHRFRRNK
ncbi:hypothetical protein K2V61_06400 [Staphylococcus simulans]|uniref:hypothetical protein n=1 Tax=Staphylococcus TaxID=1279 RepID=UPI000D030B4B|nr:MULTISPECIES: hypothetical protein [Staphylococcus]MCD8915172.1 hypothetical protein [Staphylococcus simulans]